MKAVSARLCHSAFQELLSVGLPFCQKFPCRVWGGKPHRKISVTRKKGYIEQCTRNTKALGQKKRVIRLPALAFIAFE